MESPLEPLSSTLKLSASKKAKNAIMLMNSSAKAVPVETKEPIHTPSLFRKTRKRLASTSSKHKKKAKELKQVISKKRGKY